MPIQHGINQDLSKLNESSYATWPDSAKVIRQRRIGIGWRQHRTANAGRLMTKSGTVDSLALEAQRLTRVWCSVENTWFGVFCHTWFVASRKVKMISRISTDFQRKFNIDSDSSLCWLNNWQLIRSTCETTSSQSSWGHCHVRIKIFTLALVQTMLFLAWLCSSKRRNKISIKWSSSCQQKRTKTLCYCRQISNGYKLKYWCNLLNTQQY